MLKACAWRNLYLSYDSFSLGAKFLGTVVGEACISRQENTALAGVLPDAGCVGTPSIHLFCFL